MAHKLAGLFVAGVALLEGSHAVTSAQSRPSASAQVEILVNGSPQTRYSHEGRWYVEAVKGREYAIRLHNPYAVRVAVALSVDGLNTIDARHTDASAARKWVLGPFETITISGWQTSRTDARRFEFTTEEQSYGQALGKTENLGVISAVFFRERVPAYTRDTSNETARRSVPTAPAAAAGEAREETRSARDAAKAHNEYAATGMGRRTDHAVTEVWLDLEANAAHAVNIRYEYREQLVRLGVLPAAKASHPLDRRERARGFEAGFSPEPPRR